MSNNCWDKKFCGRQPGGTREKELGVCPAATETVHDGVSLVGINDGVNGGRICWAIAGTLCGGKVQGSFADKEKSCRSCDFYSEVRREQMAMGKRYRPDLKPAKPGVSGSQTLINSAQKASSR